MKIIKLTKGQSTFVSEEDFERLTKHSWQAKFVRLYGNGGKYVAVRTDWINGKSTTVYMHREIMNVSENLTVDHIDRNTLNNQRENLRIATFQQNNWNIGIRSNNKSGYKGVHVDKGTNKFRARINISGKLKHLGLFNTAIDAAKAYNEAAFKYHGEFAYLNKI